MAKVQYVGESVKGKEDRFALVSCEASEEEDVENILYKIGYSYDGFGDGSDEKYFYVKVDDKDDYQCFMEEWKKEKKNIAAFNKVKAKYNDIMDALGYEHKTIGNDWSDGTEDWNVRDMVAECDGVLNTFYESGHSNEALKNSDSAEDKAFWRRSVKNLCKFIKDYNSQAKDMVCNGYHCSDKYDNALDEYEEETRKY